MTRIEWADETWNPVTGCTPVSEGCKNCYAQRMANRMRGRFGYPEDDPFRVTVHPERFNQPMRWRKPRMIFPCSMGDLFHPNVPDNALDEVMGVILSDAPHHTTYLMLTKRPAIAKKRLSAYLLPGNLWVGVSVENQAAADQRIPILLQIPAAVRFVSVEPMLESVDLRDWLFHFAAPLAGYDEGYMLPKREIDWVICGGETGPGARPMDPDWARSLRDQCREAGVPFFMKKMSGGTEPPSDLMVRQWPGAKSKR